MLNAAIIGCGSIAGGLDSPNDPHIITHAHAYFSHPETVLKACYDLDPLQLLRFSGVWGSTFNTYDSLDAMLENEKPDIVSVCSPTRFHAEAVKKLLYTEGVSTIICEKPFVNSLSELYELQQLIGSTGKNVVINFMRRYDPSIIQVSKLLNEHALGNIEYFYGRFAKGLYHNGSHMLELIEHLCGPIASVNTEKVTSLDNDLFGTFFIETPLTHGTVQNSPSTNFSLFELEIVLTSGRVKIDASGSKITIEHSVPSERYKNYHTLEKTTTLNDTLSHYALQTLEFALKSKQSRTIMMQHLELSKKMLLLRDRLLQETKLSLL